MPRKREHKASAKCWCSPADMGIIGGLRTYRHHEKAGDFLLSEQVKIMTQEEAKEAFGIKLKALREEKDWTQKHLANLLEVNTHHVYLLEAGRAAPSLGMAQALAQVFGVSMDELLEDLRFPRRGA